MCPQPTDQARRLALAPGSRVGPYEVVAPLGAGGMGEVYRARDGRLGREVALKILPERFASDAGRLERLRREARVLASLNHPHIATLYGIEEDGGAPVLVMELVEGATLAQRLGGVAMPVPEALECAQQMAEALDAAHERGVLHRDLKPANVRLTERGRIKLIDFGLAKELESAAGRGESAPYPSDLPTVEPPDSPFTGIAGTAPYMSPEQVRGEESDRRTDVWSFGCVLFEMLSGQRAFGGATQAEAMAAVLEKEPPWAALPDALPGAVRRLLERCLQKERDRRLRDIGDARLELEEVLQRWRRGGRLEGEAAPYPGLRAFGEDDAGRFFGREGEIAALWGKLRTRPLLAVIGPSGAGKTSFVRAGVVASRPSGWSALVCTPGSRPFAALAQALAPELAGEAKAVADLLRIEEEESALAALGRWRRSHVDVLLVVDQFEELFTLNAADVQRRFAALLGRIADSGVHVLLSMRDDFLIRCHEHRGLEAVFTELTPLLPLDGDALRRALVEPAAAEGYRFEDEALVEAMVGFVAAERGALPLLAFAMSQLWEQRDRAAKQLRRAAYEEIGGVGGALARHAEATLTRIGPEREPVVREIFRNLVTSAGTRAVMEREELLSAFGGSGDAAKQVLDALVDARLLTEYEPAPEASVAATMSTLRHGHVEIVHESLLAAWPRLVRWRTQDADGAQLRDQLRQAAHLWDARGRTPDLLWTGTAEREFELWREHYPGKLTAIEEDFARAMVARARRLARLRRIGAAATVAAALTVAVVVGVSRQQAVNQARRAEASKLLALAQLRLGADPTEALALTTASLELSDTEEARVFALKALWSAPPALELPTERSIARALAFSPDGRWLAGAGHTDAAAVWSEDGKQVARLTGLEQSPRNTNRPVWSAADVLVAGLPRFARRIQAWTVPDGRRLQTLELGAESDFLVHAGVVLTQTADPPGGRAVLQRSWNLSDGTSRALGRFDLGALGGPALSVFAPSRGAWVYARGAEVRTRDLGHSATGADRLLTRHGAEVDWLATMPVDEPSVYSRDRRGEIRVSSFGTSGVPRIEVVPKPATASARLIPDRSGRWLFNQAGGEPEVRVWPRAAWPDARPLVLKRNVSWYGAVRATHPSGDWLVASTGRFTSVTFWPLRRPLPLVVDGYSGIFRPVAFSQDGRWLATSWPDQKLRLWPMGAAVASAPRVLEAPGAMWTDAAFDTAGRFLFAVGNEGAAWIVPLDGTPPRRLGGFSEDVLLYSAALSPSGRQAAAAFIYGRGQPTLRVWNLELGTSRVFTPPPDPPSAVAEPAAPKTGYEGGISELAFADESTLYTAGSGGIRRWNVETGTQQLVVPMTPGRYVRMHAAPALGLALVRELSPARFADCMGTSVAELFEGRARPLPAFGDCTIRAVLGHGPKGTIAAVGDQEGIVRVGRPSQGEPHLLVGHEGPIDFVAISPDLKWVASTGEDNTLRLWPMPDLDQPPLHTLPHAELIAKLKSLTNFSAVPDATAPNGWKIEIGPFPGWKDVPTW